MSVISINDANFQSMITANESCIIKFYADWCGTCRLLSADFKALSSLQENNTISFMEINAELNPLSIRFAGVDDLPFFIITKNGEILERQKLEDIEAVKQFLAKIK